MCPSAGSKRRLARFARVLLVTVTVTMLAVLAAAGSSGVEQPLLEIVFIDVGQGDAVLVKSPDGRYLLIDAGEYKNVGAVVEELKSRKVDKLDCVIATHPHSDHIGGLSKIIRDWPVGMVYDIGKAHTTSSYRFFLEAVRASSARFAVARQGVSFKLGSSVTVSFLWPQSPLPSDLNDASAVIYVKYLQFDALFASDVGIEPEAALIRSGKLPDVELLKVGHHGSRHSSSTAFLKACSPEVAVIQVGAGNDYGYPQADALARLKAAGATVFRTDKDGTVLVQSDGASWSAITDKGTVLRGGAEARTEVSPAAKQAEVRFVGSVNSTVFHLASCESVKDISKANLVTYQSRADAIAKGKRPCKVCNP